MSKENKQQQIDINTLADELNTLRMEHTDLQDKYSQLETEYNTYKFDIEFKEDIKDITTKLHDKDIEVLKELKTSNNTDAYNLLIDKFSLQGYTYFRKDKNGRILPMSHIPDDGSTSDFYMGDLFTNAINEVKGE